MRILFMGTPNIARQVLEILVKEDRYKIVGVVTKEDKPRTRGHKLSYSEVKEEAILHDIPIFQPKTLKNNNGFFEEIKKLNIDIIVTIAYGKILPKELLDIPKLGCINIHASILPQYRGPAPVQQAILNGDSKTGVTLMKMDKGMDTGDILSVTEILIEPKDTTKSLLEKLGECGGKALLTLLDSIDCGDFSLDMGIKQKHELATYAPMIEKTMGKIDPINKSATEIERQIRAIPSYLQLEDGSTIKVLSAEVKLENVSGQEGDVVINKKSLIIVCKGNTALSLIEVQPSGKKAMNIVSFLNGNKANISLQK